MKLMKCRICGRPFEQHHPRDHHCPQCEEDLAGEVDGELSDPAKARTEEEAEEEDTP